MARAKGSNASADVHSSAIARFEATFESGGDAVLATATGDVLALAGPLALGVAQVGMPITALPAGVSSGDLDDCVSRVVATTMLTETAHLLLAGGSAVAARLFTVLSEDATRRYLVAVLATEATGAELGRLRRQEHVYELLFERAPSGICLVATDGTFISANPAYCQIVRRSESELLRLTFQDITYPDDLSLDLSLVAEVLARKIDRYDIDKRYLLPDGSIVWVHLTVALMVDEDDAPLFFIAMVDDITQRRRTQETLQTTLELWRTTFEHAPIAMVEVALDSTIVHANAAAGELMGCAPEELVGLRTLDLGAVEELPASAANIGRLTTGELTATTSERRFTDRRGRPRWLSVHTSAVAGADGGVDRLVMQVVDITEARELRERLQQSVDELSLAYREKAALMTALSHDLRTPLAAIRILAELLASSDESTSEHERRELTGRLLTEAARTEGVLGDLVSSERASAGLMTPRRVPVDLNDLVRRVVEVEAGHRTSHKVELCPSSVDCTVSVDPALVERMVANLLSNTFRHTRAGTTVWVSLDGDPAGDDRVVQLVVEDNGGGVPDSLKEAIFEPYVRVSADRPGTGIGLFLVRRFAEFHGGTVVCTDRTGGGASFRVTLPRA
ncbi:MAG: PAS domain S-box protein [Actinobacteria bacterium]|nr:PAS domain S-box protein [Actinomycetota bacterium]